MKQKEQKNTGKDSEGSEESKGGLDRCSVREDRNLPEQKNSKGAYRLEKDLTPEKPGRSSIIQNKPGKCLTEEKETLSR